jgi:HEAT repeat protein
MPSARAKSAVAADARPRELSDATVKAAAGWIAQFARTLKTCRLYDAGNPAVVRFRDELAHATHHLLAEHGAIMFHFGSDDVTCDGQSLYPARSRDDNFAYPFYRDGVRAMTIAPGLESAELQTLVDAVLAATGANLEDGDLVTMLWEADFQHIDIDFVPAEGDVGGTPPQPAPEGENALLPWPQPQPQDEEKPAEEQPAAKPGRSEDWMLGDLTVEVEASFEELDSLAPGELRRFQGEFTDEHLVSPVTAALAISVACLSSGPTDEDRRDLASFMPRVLRGAISLGSWADACEALRALRELRDLAPGLWNEETFLQELLQPVTVARAVERLDAQAEDGIAPFLSFATELGEAGADWMTLVLADSQVREVRQALGEAIAESCRENPERLAPWLSDGRWYVVRNIVHILGWIGGPRILGPLQTALRHDDARVRAEVVAALAQLDLRQARPLLIRALDGADTRTFCQVLSQLSTARDPATARFLFAFLQQEKFSQRPAEERRAIYAALASVGGDEIVPELSAELLRTNWFDRAQEVHRHNVGRILARIGTARAREALERGAQSRRAPVRQAAQMALASLKEAA